MATSLAVANYPVALFQGTDFALSADGDLMLGMDGDIELITGLDALLQVVLFRLRTRKGDAYYIPECGASFDEMIGLPLSQATADAATSRVTYALTHDSLFQPSDISYDTFPTEEGDGIMIIVTIDLASFADAFGRVLTFPLTLNLQEGLLT